MPAPPAVRAWRRWPAPPGYEAQWRRLLDAALELDLGPEDLAEGGLDTVAAAREWKPATVALYSKVARYGGIGLPLPRTPEPDPLRLDLLPLTQVRDDALEHLRTVAWCSLALAWPATVGQFRALRRDQVRATAHRLVIGTPDGDWAVSGALTGWHAWEEARNRFPVLAESPWVLPALRKGPGPASRVGGQLSSQALQVTFGKHAARTAGHLRAAARPRDREAVEALATAYTSLSYDSFRRLALAAGTEPVAPRGAVRAQRRAPRREG
ncbi:hypothetical protein [Goekera deserti]|nr:hypothetical protein [Goekera deserti]